MNKKKIEEEKKLRDLIQKAYAKHRTYCRRQRSCSNCKYNDSNREINRYPCVTGYVSEYLVKHGVEVKQKIF